MTPHRPLGTRSRVLRDAPGRPVAYCTACGCGWVSPEVPTVEVARAFLGDHLRDAKAARLPAEEASA